MAMGDHHTLRRYTSLASGLHLLRSGNLTLLSPATWDDRNDSFYMARYAELTKAGSVLALCFAQASETYHHWRVFTPGSDGVCIEFKKDALLDTLPPDVTAQAVDYVLIDKIKSEVQDPRRIPFLKRYPFQDEKELRLVWSTPEDGVKAKDVPFQHHVIDRVTLSPWMPEPLADSLKGLVKSFAGCADMRVYRSTLIANERWKAAVASPVVSRASAN